MRSLLRRSFVFVHRWLGAALSVVLTLWFVSGIVMMYWSYPAVSIGDRLLRAPTLRAADVKFSAEQVFDGPLEQQPADVTLTSFDGRPAYLGGGRLVYADTATPQLAVDDALLDRAAAAWSGQPLVLAAKQSVEAVDQWTLSSSLRNLRPLYKYSWPDGQQVYVHGGSGEVVQYTTTASRFWAYLGAIPHWLYIPALRTQDAGWLRFMMWSALLGVVTAVLGIAVAAWMYSPRKRYQYAGQPSSIPYRGWKRWHTVIGLAVGVIATTWSFSGLMSLEPFNLEQRLTDLTAPAPQERDADSMQAFIRMADILRGGRLPFSAYAAKSPAAAIASVPDFEVKELEYASIDGTAIYVLMNARGETRIVPIQGSPFAGFDGPAIIQRLRAAAGGVATELQVLDRYDAYYRDRRGALPLPVIKIQMRDSVGSRYYVDPKTATIVGSHSGREWVRRWLYQGLHSLDFPWLYNHRPLWDIVVITLLLGGTALCVTSLVLTWRVVARKAAALVAARIGHPADQLVLDVEGARPRT